jgi:hypothetical protein
MLLKIVNEHPGIDKRAQNNSPSCMLGLLAIPTSYDYMVRFERAANEAIATVPYLGWPHKSPVAFANFRTRAAEYIFRDSK